MTQPDRRWSLRTIVPAVVLAALLFVYVGAYYALSRRGMREANELGPEGFLYVPFADAYSSGDLGRHHACVMLFKPLNWIDQRLFGAPPPTKSITWELAE